MNNGGTWGFNHPAMLICKHCQLLHCTTSHFIASQIHCTTLHCTKHYTTLCIYIHILCETLHYITLHHYITLLYTLHHYITRHSTYYITFHHITLHSTTTHHQNSLDTSAMSLDLMVNIVVHLRLVTPHQTPLQVICTGLSIKTPCQMPRCCRGPSGPSCPWVSQNILRWFGHMEHAPVLGQTHLLVLNKGID